MAKLSEYTKNAIKDRVAALKASLNSESVVLAQKQREFDDAKARLDKITAVVADINAAIAALDKDYNEDGKSG